MAPGFSFADCEHFLGSSAGAIVAARLSIGLQLRRPADEEALGDGIGIDPGTDADAGSFGTHVARRAGAWALALASPVVPLAFRVAEPGASFARASASRSLPVRSPFSISHAELDLGDAVRRSPADRCGRPWHRAARHLRTAGGAGRDRRRSCRRRHVRSRGCSPRFRIGDHEYVDGGVWSPTNIDAAPPVPGPGSCVSTRPRRSPAAIAS